MRRMYSLKEIKDIKDMLGDSWLTNYVDLETPPFFNVMSMPDE